MWKVFNLLLHGIGIKWDKNSPLHKVSIPSLRMSSVLILFTILSEWISQINRFPKKLTFFFLTNNFYVFIFTHRKNAENAFLYWLFVMLFQCKQKALLLYAWFSPNCFNWESNKGLLKHKVLFMFVMLKWSTFSHCEILCSARIFICFMCPINLEFASHELYA